MQRPRGGFDGSNPLLVGVYIQVNRQFEVILLGAPGNLLQQRRLFGRQFWPVANRGATDITKAPFLGQRDGLTLVLGVIEARLEALRIGGQLRRQRIHMVHAQLEEALGFFDVFPGRVLPTPDRREPLSDVHLCRAGDQRGEVAVEFSQVQHRMIVAVFQQRFVDEVQIGKGEGLGEHGHIL